jgi:uracil-DNA glycosylase
MANQIRLDASWLKHLEPEFSKEYFINIKSFLKNELAEGKTIYPPPKLLFSALDMCPLDKVKVVILGQDPYHGLNQAHGLCFSVNQGVPPPPSLVNIFKELNADLGTEIPEHGHLSAWASQGVLLLNASLSVEAGKAGSHAHIGWQKFTDRIIQVVNEETDKTVFMLWGGFAKKKQTAIDESKHLILTSGHPSPLSANKGYWFGNRHFSKCNDYLKQHGKSIIDWALS